VDPANDPTEQNTDSRPRAIPERGSTGVDGCEELHFKAAIFDMDGVVTNTTAAHSKAWKQMFDEFLRSWAASHQETFVEFTHEHDYLGHVDGRPRFEGVEAFLRSRGISIPKGTPEDKLGSETIYALGSMKNVVFNKIIETEGVGVFDGTIAMIREMQGRGIKIGLATSSYNSAVILKRAGAACLFETVVDGLDLAIRGLRGKPEPDIFRAAAANLGVPSADAVVFEDAVSGVKAGMSGGFALVIGIARENNERALRENGADLVVRDLSETTLEEIDRLVQDKRTRAG
jgi:beta-phosphoglucomutase family hydrolase